MHRLGWQLLTEGWDAKTVTHVVGRRRYRSFESPQDLLCEQVAGRALRRSVGLEPGASLSIEYANIIGIPFHYMQATEQGDPGESKERPSIWTVVKVHRARSVGSTDRATASQGMAARPPRTEGDTQDTAQTDGAAPGHARSRSGAARRRGR